MSSLDIACYYDFMINCEGIDYSPEEMQMCSIADLCLEKNDMFLLSFFNSETDEFYPVTGKLINEELNKKEIELLADKHKMNISRFIYSTIKEKMEIDKLNDSQEQFMQLFDIAFKKSFDAFFKQLMVVINRIEFNSRWSIKQTDIFMNQLKIPQTEDELSLSIIDHPVTEVAHREVLKDIRKMSSKKHELDNE